MGTAPQKERCMPVEIAWTNRLRCFAASVWQTSFTLLFAAWWGGLTFYAAVVVPIGTRQLGSLEQGFVTQQVTRWHNTLLAAMTFYLLIESRRRPRWFRMIVGGLLLVQAGLWLQHQQLTALMDTTSQSVTDDFYAEHAIYLWLTTAEWLLGIAIAWAMKGPQDEIR